MTITVIVFAVTDLGTWQTEPYTGRRLCVTIQYTCMTLTYTSIACILWIAWLIAGSLEVWIMASS
jgi:hypothetical protein